MSESRPRTIFHGWFIVATIFFVVMVTSGIRSGMGVFVLPMSEDFGWSRGVISLAGALGILISGIGQPFVGNIYDKWGGRNLMLTGIVIIGFTVILLSGTFHILYFILVFSVINSIAMSAGSITTGAVIVSKWFQRRRSTAISFAAAGSSVGGLILVPFTTYMIILTNWRFTWIALGLIVVFAVFPVAYLLLRDNPKDIGLLPDGDNQITNLSSTDRHPSEGPLAVTEWRHAFASKPMWQLSFAYFICGFTTLIMAFHFVPYAIEKGFSPATAATAFGLLSAMNTVGALMVGPLADKFGNKNLLGMTYAFRSFGYLCILLLPGQFGLWAFAIIGGASWLATVPLTISLTTDFYGLKKSGTLNGIVFMSHQIGGSVGIQFGGIMRDISGSYVLPFAIGALLLVIASIVSLRIREKEYSSRYVSGPIVPISYKI